MTTVALAEWISQITYSELPQPVVQAAVRSFQNAVGCAVGGSNHPTARKAYKALQPLSSTSTCTIIGQSAYQNVTTYGTDLQSAVFINGVASHVHDYDDTHLSTVIHPAGAIVVSLIALTEFLERTRGRPTSGQAFITALVAGIESSLRVGNAVSPNHYEEGWHITGSVSSIGVAAAVSSLLHLDAERTTHALGIASTQVTGVRVHFGTDTKAFHVGRAAQNGIMAAVLAEEGFTAAIDALEGRRGWVEVVGNGANSLDAEMMGLQNGSVAEGDLLTEKKTWEIEKNTFKPFPCGIVIHPIIDACIQVHEELKLSDDNFSTEIEKVDLRVHHLVLDLTGKKTPRDGLEAKFSVYHGATVGLIFGSATPDQYQDTVVNQEAVKALRAKVTAEIDDRMRSDETFVKVTMKNGRTVTRHVEHAVGSLARPMTDEELRIKFIDQTEPILGNTTAARLNALAWKVTELENVNELVKAMR